MFETLTEKARRVIFFARHEASELHAQTIEPQHILLGLMREDRALITQFCKVSPPRLHELRERIREATTPDKKRPAVVDMNLSEQSKQVLKHSAEESRRLNKEHIGTEHLLLGLLRAAQSVPSQILTEHGIQLEVVRETFRCEAQSMAEFGKVRNIEELRRLAGDARVLGKAILRTADRIDLLCRQFAEGSDGPLDATETRLKAKGQAS
jgi:ATP-dependent Clp protease ATP-binding subunit ClpC